MPSWATSMPAAASCGALGASLIQYRIGVVDVDQDAARTLWQPRELLGHAAGAALRQVPKVAGTLVRHADADHLIVTPEGAVHQYAIAGVKDPLDRRRDARQTGAIKQLPPAAGVAKHQPDVIPDPGILAIRRVRSGFAFNRQRGDCHAWQRRDLELRAIHRDAMPVHAAEMLQYVQNRQAGSQILAHRLGSPQFQRRAVLTQQQQSGAVIDLAVNQDDRTDAGIAQALVRLQRGLAAIC